MAGKGEVERVRVNRFDWERLMLVSELPWATRSVLLALAVYMSKDGDRARPGLMNLGTVTGLAHRSLTRHLGEAVTAGYLGQVSRGGYRGGRAGGPGRVHASVYAATVPKDVFDVAVEMLMSKPWRNSPNEPATVGGFIPDGLSDRSSDDGMNPPTDRNEPANGGNEPATGDTPSRSAHHAVGHHVISASRGGRKPAALREVNAPTQASESAKRSSTGTRGVARAVNIIEDHLGVETDDAVSLVRWIDKNRPAKNLGAYVAKIADDHGLEPLWQLMLADEETD